MLRHLGAFAFFPLGIIDSSFIPLPGGMDALLIILVASRKDLWIYYTLMCTAGSVLGGYLTYHVTLKSGREPLERKLGKNRAEKVFRYFERWGFWSVFLAAIAPPPVPTAALIATAGALQYSRNYFLMALTSARLLRFTLVAWVASRYGRHIFHFFGRYYQPALWTLVGLGITGGLVTVGYYLRHRHHKEGSNKPRSDVPAGKAA